MLKVEAFDSVSFVIVEIELEMGRKILELQTL
jgi:hypothetical protein